jgi:hypothetical protein
MALSYFKDGEWKQVSVGANGKILQVVSTTLSATFTAASVASGAFATVTGLDATITPSEESSKILIFVQLNGTNGLNAVAGLPVRIMRGATFIGQPDSPGSRVAATFGSYWSPGTSAQSVTQNGVYLDSPATISAITYGIQIGNQNNGTQNLFVNRSQDDVNDVFRARYVSTITCLEVGP